MLIFLLLVPHGRKRPPRHFVPSRLAVAERPNLECFEHDIFLALMESLGLNIYRVGLRVLAAVPGFQNEIPAAALTGREVTVENVVGILRVLGAIVTQIVAFVVFWEHLVRVH